MSFFSNLFGKKPESGKPPDDQATGQAKSPPKTALPAEAKPVDPAKDKNMIRVFDGYGREMFIPKEAWRTNVLPGTIKANWNNPEALYGIILNALNDGFRSDVVAAAEHLYEIDPIPCRAACVWGIILKDEGRLDAAENVFRDFIAKYGEDGSILTNLAKVHSQRKNDSKAEEILWRGLEVDPNQDNGLLWYQSICREREGADGAEAALRRVAAQPGSWRAQLWLARTALQTRNLEGALAYYSESLSRVGKPAPADMLMQISGDLGNAAHLPELLQLVEPQFVVEMHGLQVGNNLIKAHLDLGQLDAARQILNQLYALKRPDWQQALQFWDTELTKARLATETNEPKAPLKITMLTIEGPVWLNPSSPVAKLFAAKLPDAISVCFLGSSAGVASNSQRVQHQPADAPGRMSRALPLFLAEQVALNSQARVQTLVPWITEEIAGFVLSGAPWSDENASNYARQSEHKSDYVVITHLKTQNEPWTVELRLTRTIDAKCLGNQTSSFPSIRPEESIPELGRQLLALLVEHAEVESQVPISIYAVPNGQNFPFYLLRLEQLLAVRCAGMDGVRADFLNGAREIVDGNLQLCLACPDNVTARVVLAQTLLAMNKARPDIFPEFRDKLTMLQKEKPLPEPMHGMIQQVLNELIVA